MQYDEAKVILGTGDVVTIEHVLKCLDVSYWAMHENDEFEKLDETVLAKNILLRKCVEKEMETKRFFKIAEQAPFKTVCPACKGAGEMYKFLRATKGIKCRICLGQKEVWVKCPSCDGTTIFKKKPDSKGIPCKACRRHYENEPDKEKAAKIKGKVPFRCSQCHGTGEKPILVRSHEIDTTTPCKKCKGLGFLPPQKKMKHHKPQGKPAKPWKDGISNPVLSKEIAEKLNQPAEEKPEEVMIESTASYDTVQDSADIKTEGTEQLSEGAVQKKQLPPSE